jgi:thioredoxin
MNKLYALCALSTLAFTACLPSSSGQDDAKKPADAPATQQAEPVTKSPSSPGQVVHVNSAADFDSLIKKGNVVVDFYATWCGPCKAMAPIFDGLAKDTKYSSIVFVKIDVDDARFKEIANRYNIRSIPTFIFFRNGNVVSQQGSMSAGAFRNALNSAYSL